VIGISNFRSEDNLPWPPGGAAERLISIGPSLTAQVAGGSPGAWTGDAGARFRDTWTRIRNGVTIVAWMLAGWIRSMPGGWLDRLFEMNDAEAYWRGWQITKVHGGRGRRYRDPGFDTLATLEPALYSGAGTTG
jgi:hypothetical protein